jgi:hypothetical protein
MLDFKEEQVYVVNTSVANYETLLQNKNTASGKVRVYSFEDEVLDIESRESDVELSRERSTVGCKKCSKGKNAPKECGAYGSVKIPTENSIDDGAFTYKWKGFNQYRKSGIYFTLFTDINYDRALGGSYQPYKTTISCIVTYQYKVKCGVSDAGNYYAKDGFRKFYSTYQNECKSRFRSIIYRSSKALSKYYLDADYSLYVSGCDLLYGGIAFTDIPVINFGY